MGRNIIKLQTDTDVLIDAFGLKKIRNQPIINEWTSAKAELNPLQLTIPKDIYQNYINCVGEWNEEEVKMKLISFLFYIAQIEEPDKISTFFERDLSADINNKRLSVTCDCLIATPLGLSSPKLPYFFLQAFKRRKKTQNDPEGQMLAATLIANTLTTIIYRFMVLG
jgi:hypothetical protein